MRRSRGYLTSAILQAIQITGHILKQKKFSDVSAATIERMIKRKLIPSYNPVLPRDQAAIVDEVVKLLSTNPPAISLETAQVALGRGPQEVAKILAMLQEISQWPGLKNAQGDEPEDKGDEGKGEVGSQD